METADLWNLRISAYCLLKNHYHLLVQTPDANLSRCMRHINGVYTQRFNKAHQIDGQLFRGRYRSILIDADSYLLELIRYIHRNPIKAGIVKHIEKYPWSSHHGYLSDAKKWDWLNKDLVLSMFSDNLNIPHKTNNIAVCMFYTNELDAKGEFNANHQTSYINKKGMMNWTDIIPFLF